MSRISAGKALRIVVAVLCIVFLPLVLLKAGIDKRSKKLILEGAVYSIVLFAAFSIPEGSTLYTLAPFVGMGALALAGVRLYALRDSWLGPKIRALSRIRTGEAETSYRPTSSQLLVEDVDAPVASDTADLFGALTRAMEIAHLNKDRIPTDAAATISQTCRTLEAVVDAETRRPLGDPEFEYELGAIVREYLPAVLSTYLAIPASMVSARQANGRTPNEELLEQLQLLAGQAEILHSRRHRHTSRELTNMGNFLREKFADSQHTGFGFGIK